MVINLQLFNDVVLIDPSMVISVYLITEITHQTAYEYETEYKYSVMAAMLPYGDPKSRSSWNIPLGEYIAKKDAIKLIDKFYKWSISYITPKNIRCNARNLD